MTRFILALSLAVASFAFAEEEGDQKARATPEELDVSLLPFSADTVKLVVEHHQPKIQECYEATLADKAKAVEGKLMTSFVVTPGGAVKNARVLKKGTTLRDPRLHDCVKAALLTMTFPRPSENRDYPIEFPFNLKAVR